MYSCKRVKMADEEGLVVQVEGLENEEEEEEEAQVIDYAQPMNDDGEINEGMPALWLSAEEAADLEIPPKDLTDFGVQVSVEFLQSLGLEQYIGVIEKRKLGIESLVNMNFDTLGEYIEDARDRALIIGRAKKVFVRSSAPKVDGRPVRVSAKFGIARISEINTVDLTARIKLFVDLYWKDPRLIGARPDQVPNYIWIPDCYVYNCKLRCYFTMRVEYIITVCFVNQRYAEEWREWGQAERAPGLSCGFLNRTLVKRVGGGSCSDERHELTQLPI